MTVFVSSSLPSRPSAGKRAFANLASGFVNRFRTLPGVRGSILASAIAILVCTISAPFGTGSLAFVDRLVFWATSIATMGLLWRAWFALTVHEPAHWRRAVIAGTLVLIFPLPLVIRASLALVGSNLHPEWWVIWPQSLAIGLGIAFIVLTLVAREDQRERLVAKGRLFRAGVTDPSRLRFLEADDHYCRFELEDGRRLMVHGRFADFASELADLDGSLVRRGVWISAPALDRIERDGRRLVAVHRDGRRFVVSPAGREAMKLRGWVANPSALA